MPPIGDLPRDLRVRASYPSLGPAAHPRVRVWNIYTYVLRIYLLMTQSLWVYVHLHLRLYVPYLCLRLHLTGGDAHHVPRA